MVGLTTNIFSDQFGASLCQTSNTATIKAALPRRQLMLIVRGLNSLGTCFSGTEVNTAYVLWQRTAISKYIFCSAFGTSVLLCQQVTKIILLCVKGCSAWTSCNVPEARMLTYFLGNSSPEEFSSETN